jgi:hypothetical protein
MVGTQRSAFTHRKNREPKKIKEQIKQIKTKSCEPRLTPKLQDEPMDSEDDLVTIVLIKLPNLTVSGFGTRYQVLVPEGLGL